MQMEKIKLKNTLGVIGGGQLGKMIGISAAKLGIKSYFFDPDKNAPSKDISNTFYNYKYDNKTKLLEFAKKCDFITYEFENIPINSLKIIEKKSNLFPNINTLKISQDRHLEKNFVNGLGIKTAKYKTINNSLDIENFLKKNSGTGIIKTRKLGYDGKGQFKVQLKSFKKKLDIVPNKFIIEQFIPFQKEISVIAIRQNNGKVKTFEPTENYHKAGILRNTKFPSSLSNLCLAKAKKIAKQIIRKLDIVGILAVEMFVMKNEEIIVNEIAPRPHNSGHWTLDGCNISQFDALVRTIFSLPIPKIVYSKKCKMINLLGENFNDYKQALNKSNHSIYIYGKTKIKKLRKMGHINIVN
ncbi:MAG: 5-(carboxyamino)imidazole ribonucleotide synthase [Pseudomonadota bacterium]|nr:5-(carboxyamino)imidazole ribonucleotide synthase [Pseudomonadota bacterium]